MNREQINEAERAYNCLTDARKHLDNAMFYRGEISQEDYARLRQVYELICRTQDVAANRRSVVKTTEEGNKINIQIWIM